MTEIPEHLLKRAKERRAALEGGTEASGDASPADAPTAAAPAADAGSAPAPAAKAAAQRAPLPTLQSEPTAPAPDSPVVAAAKSRKRVPFWAMPVLAMLPLWAIIYLGAIQPPPEGETDPLAIGAEVYTTQCSGCHMADGAGGAAGQQLNEGHMIETFSDPLAMAHWVSFGSDSGRDDGTYGDLDRPGGPMNTSTLAGQMPGFGNTLSADELAAVVMYVRSEFGEELYDETEEQGFVPEAYESDPGSITGFVEEVQALGDDGIDEVEEIERPEGE